MDSLFDMTPPPRTLMDIHESWAGCHRCFFSLGIPCLPNGPKTADVLVVGQWPGQDDVRSGIPFTGPQGKVCREFLYGAGFTESELFYTNVLLCTSPITPGKEILENCRGSLEDTISVVKPRLIIALGSIAAKRFKLKEISLVIPTYRGIKVVTCVHPASIARSKSREDKASLTVQVSSGLARARRVYLGQED